MQASLDLPTTHQHQPDFLHYRQGNNSSMSWDPLSLGFVDSSSSIDVASSTSSGIGSGSRSAFYGMCGESSTASGLVHLSRERDERERKYPCTYCDKKFKRNAHLSNHLRLHTGEKPFVCQACSCAFAQESALRYHLLHNCVAHNAAAAAITPPNSAFDRRMSTNYSTM